jgi:hypothetical protein
VETTYKSWIGLHDNYHGLKRKLSYDFDVQALASWRPTQGIYRLDPDFAMELCRTDNLGELPIEILKQSPEWCVYIEFPENITNEAVADASNSSLPPDLDTNYIRVGCLVRFDRVNGQEYLCFNMAITGFIIGDLPALQITPGMQLKDAISDSRYKAWGGDTLLGVDNKAIRHARAAYWLQKFLNAYIYICSANADMLCRRTGLRPSRPQPKVVRGVARYFPPDRPEIYECGYRIGAVIRKAKEARTEEIRKHSANTGVTPGQHASPVPHLRRAHWHRYWTGPRANPTKDQPTDRRIIVKWLHPILVNEDLVNAGEASAIPVIHAVVE